MRDEEGMAETVKINLSPQEILNTPLLNKGTAFTQKERDDLGLHGLIPSRISSVDDSTVCRSGRS